VWVLRRRRVAVAGAALAAIAGIAAGAYLLLDELRGSDDQARSNPAPKVVIREEQPEAAEDLGFPAFATKNTTRVAGADPAANAAAVALATFPSAGGIEGPAAVALVEASEWPAGIAAASLTAAPVRAPILITGAGSTPRLTAGALRALAPAGSPATNGHQAFVVGSAPAPPGARAQRVSGGDAAELGAAIDRLRQALAGRQPEHVVVTTSERPEYAMPAAAWAARSGDPVLFVGRDSVPKPTLDALRRHRRTPVYVLGPPSAVSDKVLRRIGEVAGGVARIGAEDPVESAIDFARYVDGTFGWNINDPGHGFVIARDSRPLDAPAAAALSASGGWGPLLLTDEAGRVPAALRGYLLDLKPGYIDDPTRAVYNHVWLIGDQDAISVGFQAQVDDLAEVAKVRSGTGTAMGRPPGSSSPGPPRPSRR
jgi:hypothetical protein